VLVPVLKDFVPFFLDLVAVVAAAAAAFARSTMKGSDGILETGAFWRIGIDSHGRLCTALSKIRQIGFRTTLSCCGCWSIKMAGADETFAGVG